MPARSDDSPGSARTSGGARRLIFLHGFTQTHHHWHRVAHAVATDLGDAPTVAFVDLPGHGTAAVDVTPIAGAGASLAELAGPGTYIGYSMGGRFALVAALARPDLVERLVLIGATPGIDDEAGRAERRRLDDARARDIETRGVDRFLDDWLALPMFAGLPDDAADLAHRRRNTRLGLATSLRTAGTGSQPSLWHRLSALTMPALVIAGDRDAKFTDIGRRMVAGMPDAEFHGVADAGHAAHTERPDEIAGLITDWFARTL